MLLVYAAGSPRPAFNRLAAELVYANARDLAARIEAGESADVFCSASPEHPRRLHAAGLLENVLYATDVANRPGLRAIEVPGTIRAVYVAGVVTSSHDRAAAAAWIDALGSLNALRAAGFGPPP